MLGIVTTPLLYAYSGLKTLGNCVLDIPQAVKQAFNTLANCFTSESSTLRDREIERSEDDTMPFFRKLMNDEEVLEASSVREEIATKSIKGNTQDYLLFKALATNPDFFKVNSFIWEVKAETIQIGKDFKSIGRERSFQQKQKIKENTQTFLKREFKNPKVMSLLSYMTKFTIRDLLNEEFEAELSFVENDHYSCSLTKENKSKTLTHKFNMKSKDENLHTVTATFDITDPNNITFNITY